MSDLPVPSRRARLPRPELPVPLMLAALAPLVLPQVVMARRFSRTLPEPAGPRAGRTGEGPPLRLLVAGDSSAAGVGVAWQDQALTGRLVRRLAQYGRGLKAGEIVLSGSFIRPIECPSGTAIAADYGAFGRVELAFA